MNTYKPSMKKKFADNFITVLVFVTEGCPYCQKAKEILKDLSRDYPFKFLLVEDTEKNEPLKEKYGIIGFPAYIILYKGKKVSEIHGLISKREHIRYFNKILEVFGVEPPRPSQEWVFGEIFGKNT